MTLRPELRLAASGLLQTHSCWLTRVTCLAPSTVGVCDLRGSPLVWCMSGWLSCAASVSLARGAAQGRSLTPVAVLQAPSAAAVGDTGQERDMQMASSYLATSSDGRPLRVSHLLPSRFVRPQCACPRQGWRRRRRRRRLQSMAGVGESCHDRRAASGACFLAFPLCWPRQRIKATHKR